MNTRDIITQRLRSQKLENSTFKRPEQVVAHMGAMQAQEYAMAKWAIGLRLPGSTDSKIEKAFNEGKILRTHLLRPTWHFVSAKDIRWLLDLTAPRVHQANAFMGRKLGLDEALLKKCVGIFVKTLQGEKHMTRTGLNDVLAKNKIVCEGHYLSYIMMYAELEGIICSGKREGKQFTYALLDERAPHAKKLSRKEALAELTFRYFESRGPATLRDYTTWSNLTVKDAREGIRLLEKNLACEKINDQDHYFMDTSFKKNNTPRSFLMPDYDEYGIGYKDRSAIFDAASYKSSVSRGNPVFNRMIIIDGRIEGTWQRVMEKGKMTVQTFPFSKLAKTKQQALKTAVKEFLDFTSG